MRIPRIYTSTALSTNQSVTLDAKAHKHLKDVLRIKIGDSVILFNGDGNDYQGKVKEITKKTLAVSINELNEIQNESHLKIHLLQPLCSSEKMDLCIQKATELGVNIITPFISSRVNISITGNRLTKKMLHWQSIIHSACEQCGRATIPTINSPVLFSEALSHVQDMDIKLISSPTACNQPSINQYQLTNCVCTIGPEGGFTEEEISLAERHGFNCLQMGPRILRLETAVISTITYCQLHWGDFC